MERSIAVVNDVKDLSELLDGASIDQARVMPAPGGLRLELDLTRACAELPPAKPRGFLARANRPWVRCRLTLNQVTDAAVQRLADAVPTQTPLLVCDAVPGGYQLTVTSPDGLRLSLDLEQLSGQFVDIGTPVEHP